MVFRLIIAFVILLVFSACTSVYLLQKELKSEIEMAYYRKMPSFVLYDKNNEKICQDYQSERLGYWYNSAGACEYLDTANYLFNINTLSPREKYYYKRHDEKAKWLSIGDVEDYYNYAKKLDKKTLAYDCYNFKNNIACYLYELTNPLINVSENCNEIDANKSSKDSGFRLGACYAKLTLALKENNEKLQTFYANKICKGGVSKYCDLKAALKNDDELLKSYNKNAFELCLNTGKNCKFIKDTNKKVKDLEGRLVINQRCNNIINKLNHIDAFYKDLRLGVIKEFEEFCEK